MTTIREAAEEIFLAYRKGSYCDSCYPAELCEKCIASHLELFSNEIDKIMGIIEKVAYCRCNDNQRWLLVEGKRYCAYCAKKLMKGD